MDNLLNLPKPINELTDLELEEERIRLLANKDEEDNFNKRYNQLVYEIVKRMWRIE